MLVRRTVNKIADAFEIEFRNLIKKLNIRASLLCRLADRGGFGSEIFPEIRQSPR